MTSRYVTAAVARELAGQLSERDHAVTRRVCELRFVSGSQLARMHFTDADPRTTRRSLLRLTRLDVLERLPRVVGGVRAGSAGYIYRLGLAGQRLALELGWLPDRRTRRSRIPGTLFVDHALAVAELHTQLVEANRSRRIELLELRAEPACWRELRRVGAQRAMLKPDSFVRLGLRDYEFSYFIEVDLGTEGSRALDGKLRDYLAYETSGAEQAEHGVFPKTLWTVPDARRARAIEDCIDRLPHLADELFGVVEFDEALDVLAAGNSKKGTTRDHRR